LSPHFKKVIATDASAEQITHASGPANVQFRVATAESSGLEDGSVNLITVAQAAHWFDLPAFYAEARRVLKTRGVIALWGYGRLVLPGKLDEPFDHFYSGFLGPYWPPERRLIDEGYRSLDFPFDGIHAPDFFIKVEWNLPRLLAYLSTWSAVKRYEADNGHSPLPGLESGLATNWEDPDKPLALKWPLFMRAGLLK
jgi:SAM-dependent methyltransferase